MTYCHILILLDIILFILEIMCRFLISVQGSAYIVYEYLAVFISLKVLLKKKCMNNDANLRYISALKIKHQLKKLGCTCIYVLCAACSWEETSCRHFAANLLKISLSADVQTRRTSDCPTLHSVSCCHVLLLVVLLFCGYHPDDLAWLMDIRVFPSSNLSRYHWATASRWVSCSNEARSMRPGDVLT